jgi:hypothetical protein
VKIAIAEMFLCSAVCVGYDVVTEYTDYTQPRQYYDIANHQEEFFEGREGIGESAPLILGSFQRNLADTYSALSEQAVAMWIFGGDNSTGDPWAPRAPADLFTFQAVDLDDMGFFAAPP